MLRRAFRFVLAASVVAGLAPMLAQTSPRTAPAQRPAAGAQTAAPYFPERFDWQHKKPEEVGMDSARIAEAVKCRSIARTRTPRI